MVTLAGCDICFDDQIRFGLGRKMSVSCPSHRKTEVRLIRMLVPEVIANDSKCHMGKQPPSPLRSAESVRLLIRVGTLHDLPFTVNVRVAVLNLRFSNESDMEKVVVQGLFHIRCFLVRLSYFVHSPAFRRKFGLPIRTNSSHFPAEAGTTSRFRTVELVGQRHLEIGVRHKFISPPSLPWWHAA